MNTSSETASSSPVAASSVSKKGTSAFLVTLNQHKATLGDHGVDIEGLHVKYQRLTDETQSMRSELDLLRGTVTVQGKAQLLLEERLAKLEEDLEDAREMRQLESEEEADDEAKHGASITRREEEAIAASLAAYSDTSLKELTRIVFAYKLGIAKLTPPNLPWYPENPDQMTWPRITGTEDPVLRFRWDKSWDNDDNFYSLRMIVGHMKAHGNAIVPASIGPLLKISAEDLQRRVVEKFVSLQKGLREAGVLNGRNERVMKEASASVAPENGEDVAGAEVAAAVKVEARKKTAQNALLTSRANGKLTVRLRQRENLPENSPYHDAKYDAAFVAKQMSDDEDELDEAGRKTGRYVSHAPAYRSKELKDLFAALDAVPIETARYIQRVRGEVRDEPPKRSTLLKNRTRRWMVDPDWLAIESNEKYDVETRIIDSGKAWGDDEDPEVLFGQREALKSAKKVIAETKKRKIEADVLKSETSKKAKMAKGRKGKGKVRALVPELTDDEESD